MFLKRLICPKCGKKFKPHQDSPGMSGIYKTSLCLDCWDNLVYRAIEEGFTNLFKSVNDGKKQLHEMESKSLVKCAECGWIFNGWGAYLHTINTGHNRWELLLPKS